MKKVLLLATMLLAISAVTYAVDHSEFITGKFENGSEVTKACLECHEDQADAFMTTPR
jgi:cytochrome c2